MRLSQADKKEIADEVVKQLLPFLSGHNNEDTEPVSVRTQIDAMTWAENELRRTKSKRRMARVKTQTTGLKSEG